MFSLVETNRRSAPFFSQTSSYALVSPSPCHLVILSVLFRVIKKNLFRLSKKITAYTYLLLGTFSSFFNPVAEKASTKLKHTRGAVKMG